MSIGTYEGDIDEIKLVKLFNEKKSLFKDFLISIGINNIENIWMIRVTTKQLSKLSNQKVFTRADCYLGSFDIDISNFLLNNDFYLSEDNLLLNSIPYKKLSYTGISVKMTTSKSYQILKLQPNSFNRLLGNYELGAGASLFCLKEVELCKNSELLTGWNTNIENMIKYFSSKGLQITEDFISNQIACKQIKDFSCKEIEKLINNSKSLQEKIFNGKDLYEEPYTAWYFYHGVNIEPLSIIPFSVTTGSGRSHGDYTIVLKPINR